MLRHRMGLHTGLNSDHAAHKGVRRGLLPVATRSRTVLRFDGLSLAKPTRTAVCPFS